MKNCKATVNRRTLLSGMGAAALSLPFLRNVPSAHAADAPKRFIVFFSPNEPIERKYWQPGSNMALTQVMQPLQRHAAKLVTVGGMKMHTRDLDDFGGGHVGIGHLLTGEVNVPYGSENSEFWAGGVSVDQYIAREIGCDALTLGARTGGSNGNGRISYTGRSEPVHPYEDPLAAFSQVLGDYQLDPSELEAKRGQQKSVLDAVAGQLGGINASMSSEDRRLLELHLDRIRELEQGLTGPVISCDPTTPAGGFAYGSNADYPITARRHMDVLVQALACGVTQVGSLQLGNSGGGGLTPLWPDFGVNINIDEHNIAHNYNNAPSSSDVQSREQLETFYYEQFAYLLDQLAAVPEGSGSLLDNTLVLWTKPIGKNHNGSDMLFMLAGGAGGALQTGRHLELPDMPHNNLLVSCCQLMGLSDVTSFGNASVCTGAAL